MYLPQTPGPGQRLKQQAPGEPDDAEAGLDDTVPFQYHRRSRAPSAQNHSIVDTVGPTKQVGILLKSFACVIHAQGPHLTMQWAVQARTQHVDNLMAVLEEGLLQCQYDRVAQAASILVPLLVSTPPCHPYASEPVLRFNLTA